MGAIYPAIEQVTRVRGLPRVWEHGVGSGKGSGKMKTFKSKQAVLDYLALLEKQLEENWITYKTTRPNNHHYVLCEIIPIQNKIAELKNSPILYPEISHQLRAWRGERSIRDILSILQNALGEEISINLIARIEQGKLDCNDELAQNLKTFLESNCSSN